MAKIVFFLCLLSTAHVCAAEPNFFSPDCPRPMGSQADIVLAMTPANETSLFSSQTDPVTTNSYRLTVLPAYGGVPSLIVRLAVNRSSGTTAFVFDSLPFRPAALSTTLVDAAMAREFEKAYRITDFSPVFPTGRTVKNGRQWVSVGIRDGNGWVLEALVDGKYFCVEQSARASDPFRDLGRSLLRFAGRNADAYR